MGEGGKPRLCAFYGFFHTPFFAPFTQLPYPHPPRVRSGSRGEGDAGGASAVPRRGVPANPSGPLDKGIAGRTSAAAYPFRALIPTSLTFLSAFRF